ncbi:MAG: hypothetical protein WCH93_09995 [Actinomycetota bacterium]
MSRRALLLAAAATPAALLLAPEAATAGSRPIILSDPTVRAHGPVMFIGDSTSSRLWRTMRKDIAAAGIGPFRLDLQPGRSISRRVGWGTNAITSVRNARLQGFDPPAYVLAVGFPDIHRWAANRTPIVTVDGLVALIEPLLREIGADRTVAFLNLYSKKKMPTAAFNGALARLAVTWPNLSVVDWAALARQHRGWHISDGYHFTYFGARQRQKFIAQTMIDVAR